MTLTPQERAAIDAYPQDRIRRIPAGVSGLPLPVWDGVNLRDEAGGLRRRIRADVASAIQKRQRAGAANRERVAAVMAAHPEWDGVQVTQHIGDLSINTVRGHMRAIREGRT